MSPLLSWPGVDHERVCGLSSTQMWWLQSRQTPPSLSCELSGSSSSHCVSQSQPTHTRVHHHTHHNTTPHTTSSPHLNYTNTTPQSVFQLQADVIENEFQCEAEMDCNKQSNMKSILWNILILLSGVKRREDSVACFYLVLNVNILTVRVLLSLKRIELIKIWIHSIHYLQLQLQHIKYQDKPKTNK